MKVLKRLVMAFVDAFRLMVVCGMRCLEWGIFWLPLKQNRVLFYLHARKGYTCNLKAILEELLKAPTEKFEFVWVTKWPEAVRQLEARGVKVVKLYSLRHFWMQLSAKVILISDAFPHLIRIRRGQVTLNAWHGGMNYKHIGEKYCQFKNLFRRVAFWIANQQPTHFISGSRFFTENTSASFNFDASIFLPIGLPRNDLFFRENVAHKVKESIFKRYSLPKDTRVVLFAPTFREGMVNAPCGIDFNVLRETLTKRFGGTWAVFYRAHYFVKQSHMGVSINQVIDVTQYEDMNELLVASDVLISDYSSSLWDFALTQRPSFVYAPDLDRYQHQDRDFAYPLKVWPYPIAQSEVELMDLILTFDAAVFGTRIQEHQKGCGSYDKGCASYEVAKLITKTILKEGGN